MMRRSAIALAALTVAGWTALASPAGAVTRSFTVSMTGAEEVPNPGDPDGVGTARFQINTDRNQICFVLVVSRIEPASAAHIHVAPRGEPGPVVVPLPAPTNGRSSGCVVDADADAIVANPAAYYVNVHNSRFPGGAVRGQLG